MYNYYLQLKNKSELKNIIWKLNSIFWLPLINKQLSLYSKYQEMELIIRFINKKCWYKINNSHTEDNPYIEVYNSNIKFLFKYFWKLWFTKWAINEIVEFNYPKKYWYECYISLNTYLWDLLKITVSKKEISKSNIIKFFGLNQEILSKKELDHIINEDIRKNKRWELIINSFNVLSDKILKYADETWISLLWELQNLKEKINSFWNNYSFYEKGFELITWSKLTWERPLNQKDIFSPVSIVIPAFNSELTIFKTLYSIEYQNLPKEYLNLIQVIIVDDESVNSLHSQIKEHLNSFSFDLNIIRLEKNRWRSWARNIWISASKYDNIICIDSDIILSKNYIREHATRLSLIKNAIFISFRKNIDSNSEITEVGNIIKWLDNPLSLDDNRISRKIFKWQESFYPIQSDKTIELLWDSNYFKNLWYGRNMWIYDLPMIVSSHNLSFSKKNIKNLFSENFKWWWMEDSFFWAKAISEWNFVIPVLSAWVYHIKHPPRSSNKSKQKLELKRNMKIYKDLLHKTEVNELN